MEMIMEIIESLQYKQSKLYMLQQLFIKFLKNFNKPKPYLEQIACGKISPNKVMNAVDNIKPITPLVISAVKIEIPAFTITFPINKVHNNKFPLLRTGLILCAYTLSFDEPEVAII